MCPFGGTARRATPNRTLALRLAAIWALRTISGLGVCPPVLSTPCQCPSSSFLVRGIDERIRDLPRQAEMTAHSHRAVPTVTSPICMSLILQKSKSSVPGLVRTIIWYLDQPENCRRWVVDAKYSYWTHSSALATSSSALTATSCIIEFDPRDLGPNCRGVYSDIECGPSAVSPSQVWWRPCNPHRGAAIRRPLRRTPGQPDSTRSAADPAWQTLGWSPHLHSGDAPMVAMDVFSATRNQIKPKTVSSLVSFWNSMSNDMDRIWHGTPPIEHEAHQSYGHAFTEPGQGMEIAIGPIFRSAQAVCFCRKDRLFMGGSRRRARRSIGASRMDDLYHLFGHDQEELEHLWGVSSGGVDNSSRLHQKYLQSDSQSSVSKGYEFSPKNPVSSRDITIGGVKWTEKTPDMPRQSVSSVEMDCLWADSVESSSTWQKSRPQSTNGRHTDS
ncbi:hypothetical protein BASA61_005530 [Batrachochytrium salamandrivorans]|nr:hypothetical protein BASA61_005530 [Batrachochytrium salamandrivorans]